MCTSRGCPLTSEVTIVKSPHGISVKYSRYRPIPNKCTNNWWGDKICGALIFDNVVPLHMIILVCDFDETALV